MTDLPAPLTPPDCDLRAFRTMPLDVVALRRSAIVRKVSPEAFRAAVMLWAAAWHEVPAASLPDDDDELADRAGYGFAVDAWRLLKAEAMRGFTLCSDGRWYHDFMSGEANEAWGKRQKYRARAQKGGEAKASKPPKEKAKPATSTQDASLKQKKNVLEPAKGEGKERERNITTPTPSGPGQAEAAEPDFIGLLKELHDGFPEAFDLTKMGTHHAKELRRAFHNGATLDEIREAGAAVCAAQIAKGTPLQSLVWIGDKAEQFRDNRLNPRPARKGSGPAPFKPTTAPDIAMPTEPAWWAAVAPAIAAADKTEFASFFARAEIAGDRRAIYAETGVAEERMRRLLERMPAPISEIEIIRRAK